MLCQALYMSIKEEKWSEMHEKIERGPQEDRSKRRLYRRMLAWEKVAWRKTSKESFFSAKVEQGQATNRRSRESLLSIWRVHVNQALRMCDDRQAEVDDAWPSRFGLMVSAAKKVEEFLVGFFQRVWTHSCSRPLGLTLDRTHST